MLPESILTNKNNPAGLPVRSNNFGKGNIVCIDVPISLKYANTGNDSLRQTVNTLVRTLFPNPKVTVNSEAKVHVTVNSKNSNTLVHLVNVGDHFDTLSDDRLEFKLPAITNPITLSVAETKAPKAVKLQPGNMDLAFTYNNGVVKFEVPGVDVYSIVEISK